MNIREPIITSLLDEDLYKFTMGAVAFHFYPRAKVRYEFINRGQIKFPDGFAEELNRQIYELTNIRLTKEEGNFLDSLPYMRPSYVSWLRGYRYDMDEVKILQTGGDLSIIIEGYWFRTILWEVKLMAIISELYFRMTGATMASDWYERILKKSFALTEAGCQWNDFGTRRRFSKWVQGSVVNIMKNHKGFLGTSNVHLAMIHGVSPVGTYAHEAVMAMSYINPWSANQNWNYYWREYYGNELNIVLTDTFTTDHFLKDWCSVDILSWGGLRQDSGCPHVWANKIINHYRALDCSLKETKLVFSDNLDVPKAINLHNTYKDIAIPIFGIGTNFTNDVFTDEQKAGGIKPLNMVIKLKSIGLYGDQRWKNVVKLSDSPDKYTGDPIAIEEVKKQLKIYSNSVAAAAAAA